MTRSFGPHVTATVLALAGAAASAQTVYRCGPDGREYSQTPCKDGRAVDVSDPRSAAQQREAKRVAADQRRLTDQLEAERRQREAAALGQAPTAIVSPRSADAAEPASAARSTKGKAAPTTARVPPPARKPAKN
jgi:hypothetical protein